MERRKLKAKRRAGGSQKETQEMDFDPQPNSNSSPSSSLSNVEVEEKIKSQQPTTLAFCGKTENGPPKKNWKEESKSQSENQIQTQVEDQSFIDELPLEMLMKIFKYLKFPSLFNCRLVSRRWNQLAREILRSSMHDAEIGFDCTKTKDGKLGISRKGSSKASLSNFIQCFADSTESPLYTHFRFDSIESVVFDHPDWLKFTSSLGESIKRLKLEIYGDFHMKDLRKLTVKLRNLLLNQVPNLQEFGLNPPLFHYSSRPFKIHLFPTTTTSASTSTVELPHLKVLYLLEESFSRCPGIVTDLLVAAVNLIKIELFFKHNSDRRIETFQLLQSFGKLGCVQGAEIRLDDDFMYKIKKNPPLAFKLKELTLNVSSIYKTEAFWSDASVFVAHLFESSKDTLRDLWMNPIGFLPNFQVPKFRQLTKLCIYGGVEEETQVLPVGINIAEMFPLLQVLQLRVPWTNFVPRGKNQTQILCLQNLKILTITSRGMTEEHVAQISQVCPNLKELKIWPKPLSHFPEVGKAIWTHLSKLESLSLQIDVGEFNAFPAVDSCFTGFSGEDCERLYEELTQVENEKSAEKQGSQQKVSESESESQSELEAERKHASILDLKDLKNLTVHLDLDDRRMGKTKADNIVPKKTLVLSEKYAFNLMDGLCYNFSESGF